MVGTVKVIKGRPALFAAAGDTPYTRITTTGDGEITGYLADGVIAWTGPGPAGVAVGDGPKAGTLFSELLAAGLAASAIWLHLPRVPAEALRLPHTHRDDWEYLWTTAPPPLHPAEPRVVPLTAADEPAINAVLDDALPDSTTRPGDRRVRRWYGVWDGDRLVACGADRSRGEVGFLAGLAVATGYRGQGLGAALTASLSRHLFLSYRWVSLGVMTDNPGALHLYHRLGFTNSLPRTSIHLPTPHSPPS
jgi:GNAT superfamily N-acetyltransferase